MNISIKKLLVEYNNLITQTKLLNTQINYYTSLLSLNDLSGFDYYKKKTFLGIRYISPVFSPTENEAFKREKIHKLNYQVILDIRNEEQKKLLNIKKQIKMINDSMHSLSEKEKNIIKLKFMDNRKLTYKDIILNLYDKYKYYLDERTIIRTMNNAIKRMDKNIKKIGIDIEKTVNLDLSGSLR